MLSYASLPGRNVRYYFLSNLPVLLGVALGTAVLTGALIVGDSLRGSLRDRALCQLHGVGSSLVGTRFLRADLAGQLPETTIPALMIQGSVQYDAPGGATTRIGRVNVIGLDDKGWKFFGLPPVKGDHEAVISHEIERQLKIPSGANLELRVEKASLIPRSSFLGRRAIADTTSSVKFTVGATLPSDHPANDFNLSPDPGQPINLFVPLVALQKRIERPGKVNALLSSSEDVAGLNEALRSRLTLDDWGYTVVAPGKPAKYVVLESSQLVLDPVVVAAANKSAESLGLRSSATMTYLANAVAQGSQPVLNEDNSKDTPLMGYAIVAAVDPKEAAPLGPFLPPGVTSLADDEIALLDWPESPLKDLKPGTPITVTFFQPELEAGLDETSATFRFRGFVPFTGAADDPNLTPPFPGITDRAKIRSTRPGEGWNAPFPLNYSRIKSADDRFWEKHRTTPKAYITRARGEQLFKSRFGTYTSIRYAPRQGETPEQTASAFREKLLQSLDPAPARLVFQPTRQRLLAASRGGTDFAMLLLMFSGLLIATALLLIGLLFRLLIEKRSKQLGLLLATGYSIRQVRRLLLVEGLILAVIGGGVGLVGAVGYAELMLKVLGILWPDETVLTFLKIHVTPLSLILGFVLSVLVVLGTLFFGIRGMTRVPPPALLRGVTTLPTEAASTGPTSKRSLIGAAICIVLGLVVLGIGGTRSNPDERSGAFFSGGGLLLIGGLLAARGWLRTESKQTIHRTGFLALVALGRRSMRRNRQRSLLTMALIACSTFLIISVESFRRKPDQDFLTRDGGSGGFRLMGQTDVPLFQPFDRGAEADDLFEQLQEQFQKQEARNPQGPSREQLLESAKNTLKEMSVFSLSRQAGDDASCLNLYQADRPIVLGVPQGLIERGGFRFGQSVAESPEEVKNPWRLLQRNDPDAIPAIVEQNTAMFMLKTPVGGTFDGVDESGQPVRFRIVGLLQDSPFQSEVLVSAEQFRRLYPKQEGSRVFLIDVPAAQEAEVASLLEQGLQANGMTVTSTKQRVAAYQRVVGAYLTTFQLLGAFALVLAMLGLAIVMVRSVWERTGELALLRAVGYRPRALQVMIGAETIFVLAAGLGIGTVAALASVLPNLALGGSLPWTEIVGLLVVVGGIGLIVAIVTTALVTRQPLVPALRKD